MNSSFSFSEDTIGFLLDGVVDESAIEKLWGEIKEKLERFGNISLYLEDNGIERFTLPAIVNEILHKIEHADKINKVALVTNRKWIKACGDIENLFLPTQIKSFDIEERLTAMSWIAAR